MNARAKILFIGIDSADGDLIRAWANAGVLPTFRELLRRGTWGVIKNPPGLFVGALWPSFSTGLSPARHGRFWFRQLRGGTYQLHRHRPHEIRGSVFWEALSRAGRRIAVIDGRSWYRTS